MRDLTRAVGLLLAVFLALQWGASPPVQAVPEEQNYIWSGGGSGNWNDLGNWNPAGVPNAPDATAWIDNTGAPVIVTLDSLDPLLWRLTVDAADTLQVNGRTLSFNRILSGNPTITNNGVIRLNASSGTDARFQVDNPALDTTALLTGSGRLILGGALNNYISRFSTQYQGVLVNDVAHTIEGGGTISAPVTNRGKVVANNQVLRLEGPLTNEGSGSLSASGSGNILELAGAILGGSVRAGSGTVSFVAGGSLTDGYLLPGNGAVTLSGGAHWHNLTLGPGTAQVTGEGWLDGNSTLKPASTLKINPGGNLWLGSGDSPVITNNGTIRLAGGPGGEATLSLLHVDAYGQATLTGTGRLILGGTANNRIAASGEGWLINDANHTIMGGGTIDANVRLTNRGALIANNQTLRVLGNVSQEGYGSTYVTAGNVLEVGGSINNGTVDASYGTLNILTGGALSGVNLLPGTATTNLKGGTLNNTAVAAGTLNVTGSTSSYFAGAITTSTGTTVDVTNGDLYLRPDTVVTNQGEMRLVGTQHWSPFLLVDNSVGPATATLSGPGRLILYPDDGARIRPSVLNGDTATLINDAGHTIEGGGTIAAGLNLTNRGTILANNQTLYMEANVTQEGAGSLTALGAGHTLEINGATVTGGTVAATSSGTLRLTNDATLNNVTLNAAGGTAVFEQAQLRGASTLASGAFQVGEWLDFHGAGGHHTLNPGVTLDLVATPTLWSWVGAYDDVTLTNNGTIRVNGVDATHDAGLWTDNFTKNITVTLTGSGRLVLGGQPYNYLWADTGPYTGTFINEATHTIEGGGTILRAAVTNRGQIIANNQTLKIDGATITNEGAGLVQADGGTLELAGTIANGTVDATGGTLNVFGGTLSGVTLHAGTASTTLVDGILANNTVVADGLVKSTGHSTIYGAATINAGATIQVADTALTVLRLQNNAVVTNNGIIRLDATPGADAYLQVFNYTSDCTATLTGTGRLILGGALNNYLQHHTNDYAHQLINDTGHTIEGGGTVVQNFNITNKGSIIANNQTLRIQGNVTQEGGGTVRAEGSGNTLEVASGGISGGNVASPSGGTVLVNGGSLANLSLDAAGGTVRLKNNASLNSVSLNAAGGTAIEEQHIYLSGNCSLVGGTLQVTGNLNVLGGSHTINTGAAVQIGPLAIMGCINDSTITNDGLIQLNPTGGNWSSFSLHSQFNDVTLDLGGTGRLVMGGPGSVLDYYQSTGYHGTIIQGADHTIEGGGIIRPAITNRGLILANNQTLYLQGNVTQEGAGLVQTAAGATLQLAGTITNGTVDATNGTLNVNGGTLSGVTLHAGTATTNLQGGTLANTTLASGTVKAIGETDNFLSGAITIAAGATLQGVNGDLYLRPDTVVTNQGQIRLESNTPDWAAWFMVDNGTGPATATLTGTGSLVMVPDNGALIGKSTPSYAATLINNAGHTIQGGGDIAVNVTNRGLILADNQTLGICSTITNEGAGLVKADGGTLYLFPGNTSTGTIVGGTVDATNGTLNVNGGTLSGVTLHAGTATTNLTGGTLSNTTIGSGVVKVVDDTASYVNGANTIAAGALVKITDADLWLANSTVVTNQGELRLEGTHSTGYAHVFLDNLSGPATATFTGSGQVVLGGDDYSSRFDGLGGAHSATLVNDAGHTIRGRGIFMAGLNLTNRGNIVAEGGFLDFYGPVTNEGTGGLSAPTGGYLTIRNTLTGGTVAVTGGSVGIAGGVTAHNVTLSTTSGTFYVMGTLNNCTLSQGAVNLWGGQSAVNLSGTTVINPGGFAQVVAGTASLADGAVVDNQGGFYVLSGKSLSVYNAAGAATATFQNSGALFLWSGTLLPYTISNTATLINDVGHTIQGYGTIATGLSLTNRGLILADNQTLYVNNSITQEGAGTVQTAAGATLQLAGTITNGTVDAINGTLNITGGALSGVTLLPGTGTTNLAGGTITAATVGAGVININTTSYIGAGTTTTNSGTTINVAANQALRLKNSAYLKNYGTVNVTASGAKLEIYNPSALASPSVGGTGHLVLGTDNHIARYSGSYAAILWNNTGHTIEGGGFLDSGVSLFNRGTVLANNGTLRLNGVVNNDGGGAVNVTAGNTLEVGGYLVFGTLDPPTGGTVNFVAGSQLQSLLLSADQGTVNLKGGELQSVTFLDGAAHVINGGDVYLTGANTINAGAQIAVDYGSLKLPNGAVLTNQGEILLNAPSGLSASLQVYNPTGGDGTATLTGTGRLIMGGGGNNYLSRFYGNSATLVNDVDHTIEGSGTIYADLNITNRGSILSNNQTLYVNNSITQEGAGTVMTAAGATLQLAGTISGGTVDATNGTLNIGAGGALSGVNLLAGNATTNLQGGAFNNVTVAGGWVNVQAHTTNYFTGDNTLAPTTADTVLAAQNGAVLHNSGSIILNGSFGAAAHFFIDNRSAEATVTLTGAGRLILGGSINNYIGSDYYSGYAATLINAADHTIEGGGTIVGAFDIHNQGAILANNQTLTLGADVTQSGAGAVRVTNSATLELASSITNGTVDATGGTLNVRSWGSLNSVNLWSSNETVHLLGGTLSNSTINLGLVNVGSGGCILSGHLTIMSGAQVRVMNGDLDLNPDTVVTNHGQIKLESTVDWSPGLRVVNDAGPATVTLAGTGSLVMLPDYGVYLGKTNWNETATLVNEAGHIIQGGGAIEVDVINRGNIIANNQTLLIYGYVSQEGAGILKSQTGGALELCSTTVTGGGLKAEGGEIALNYATLTGTTLFPGSGLVHLTEQSMLSGGNTILPGAVITLGDNEHLLVLDASVTTNHGVINISGDNSALCVYNHTAAAIATLAGSGRVVLGHDNSCLGYCSDLNDRLLVQDAGHTIEGRGAIYVPLLNRGTVLANNQTLKVDASVTQEGAGLLKSQTGGILELYNTTITGGWLQAEGGEIALNYATLTGVTLKAGPGLVHVPGPSRFEGDNIIEVGATLTLGYYHWVELQDGSCTANNGIINISENYGALVVDNYNGPATATLTGSGRVVMAPGDTYLTNLGHTYEAILINDAGHTIQGSGTICINITNNGLILADNQALCLLSAVTNYSATNGRVVADGPGNILEVTGTASITNGTVTAQNSGTVNLAGAIINATVDATNGTLNIAGGTLSGVNLHAGAATTNLYDGHFNSVNVASGTVQMLNCGYAIFTGSNTIAAGATLLAGEWATLQNEGTITLNGTAAQPATFALFPSEAYASLTGSGRLILGGDAHNYIKTGEYHGAVLKNWAGHTIEGGGTIAANVEIQNWGAIIANNQTLRLNGPVSNAPGAGVQVADGAILEVGNRISQGFLNVDSGGVATVLYGGWLTMLTINAGSGAVTLQGGSVYDSTLASGVLQVPNPYPGNFQGGNTIEAGAQVQVAAGGRLNLFHTATVANEGEIQLLSELGVGGKLLVDNQYYDSYATLTGSGAVVLGGDGATIGATSGLYCATLINEVNHTIRGGGSIEVEVLNRGSISVDDGQPLTLQGGVTQEGGSVNVAYDATLEVNGGITGGTVDNNGGSLNVNSSIAGGSQVNHNGGGLFVSGEISGSSLNAGGGWVNVSGAIRWSQVYAGGGSFYVSGTLDEVSLSAPGGVTLDGGTFNNVTVTEGFLYAQGNHTHYFTGTNSLAPTSNGAYLYAADGAVLENSGNISLNADGINDSSLVVDNSAQDATVTLSGNGSSALTLGGAANNFLKAADNLSGYTATLWNGDQHTIEGGGTIAAGLDIINWGSIIANNQTLYVEGNVTQEGDGKVEVYNDATLQLSGSIHYGVVNVLPNGILNVVTGGSLNTVDLYAGIGTTNLQGGAFDGVTVHGGTVQVPAGQTGYFYGTNTFMVGTTLKAGDGAVLLNDGTLLFSASTGSDAALVVDNSTQDATVTLVRGEGGCLTLGGAANNYLKAAGTGYTATLINDTYHVIQGGGTIAAGLNVVNQGAIIANNQTLRVQGQVSGVGSVSVQDNATLALDNHIQCGNLTMSRLANLIVAEGKFVDVQGNFTFYQQDTSRWYWGEASVLNMTGGGVSLEIGGQDHIYMNGFTDNFHLEALQITGTGAQVQLNDLIDNGHRFGGYAEALYAEFLVVGTGATLNLHGLDLWTIYLGQAYLVQAGDGYLFGGGVIVNHTPVPATVLLLGSGLLALLGLRRKFGKK